MTFTFNPDEHPELMAAVDDYDALADAGQADTPAGRAALDRCLQLAPPSLIEAMGAELQRSGLLPEQPCDYRADGTALYALSEVCARLGISEEEALAFLAEANPTDSIHSH